MELNTAIFDMDGLLIDSEPWWEEAGMETLQQFGVSLSSEQYHFTTGLRTKEWIEYWFGFFGIPRKFADEAEALIIQKALDKIGAKAVPMPGYRDVLEFFYERGFKIGLATSSPTSLIQIVVDKLDIRKYFKTFSSAEGLMYSKPHPQVYLECLARLDSPSLQSLCFEDSFNGMISVKAARMKCVIIPAAALYDHPKWGAADLKIAALTDFGMEELLLLQTAEQPSLPLPQR
jgi:sugar-phosphatase